MSNDIVYKSATELAALIRSGDVSSVELTRAWPERLDIALWNIDENGDEGPDQAIEGCAPARLRVRAVLSRGRGQVSENTPVDFNSFARGNPFGTFHSITPSNDSRPRSPSSATFT